MLCAKNKGKKGNDKPPKIYPDQEQEVQFLVPLALLLYRLEVSLISETPVETSETSPES